MNSQSNTRGDEKSSPADLTAGFDYEKLVQEEIKHYGEIEITSDLREGGIHAQEPWTFWFHYLRDNHWHTSFEDEIVTYANSVVSPRLLSLGCGYGGIELDVARSLQPPYEMIAMDLNDGIMNTARARAKEENLNIQFHAADLNYLQLERENYFDIVFAHASLHHLLNLERVMSEITKSLKPSGRLIILDMIGKTQVLFWKENVDFAIRLLGLLPVKYVGTQPGELILPYSEPEIQVGMEGIRQEEIEAILFHYFTPHKMFRYGCFMRMLCTNPMIANAFRLNIDEDRRYLAALADLDVMMVESKLLRPTELFGVFLKGS